MSGQSRKPSDHLTQFQMTSKSRFEGVDIESRLSKMEQSIKELNQLRKSTPFMAPSIGLADYSNQEVQQLRVELLEEMNRREQQGHERLNRKLREQLDQVNRDFASVQSQFQVHHEDKEKQDEKIAEVMIYAENISQGHHELKMKVNDKAEKYEFLELKLLIDTQYTPLTDFNELRNSLADLVPKSSFNDVHKQNKQMYSRFPQLVDRVTLLAETQKLKDQLIEFQGTFQTKYNAEKARDNIGSRIDLAEYETTKLQRSFSEVDQRTVDILADLQKRVYQTQLEQLQEQLKDFSSKDDFERLQSYLIKQYRETEKAIKKFETANTEQKQMIRRFDQILLQKASKFSLGEVNDRFKGFTTKTEQKELAEQMATQFRAHEDKFQSLQGMIEEMSKAIGRQIFQAVRRATAQITQKQNDQINTDELKEILTKKADKADLTAVLELKSNKIDLQQTMGAVDTVYRQIQHLIVIIVELLRTGVGSAETKLSKQNKRMFLLKQALHVCEWITKFEKGQRTNQDIQVPAQLKTYQSYVKQFFHEISKNSSFINPPKHAPLVTAQIGDQSKLSEVQNSMLRNKSQLSQRKFSQGGESFLRSQVESPQPYFFSRAGQAGSMLDISRSPSTLLQTEVISKLQRAKKQEPKFPVYKNIYSSRRSQSVNPAQEAHEARQAVQILKQVNLGKLRKLQRKGKRLNTSTILTSERDSSLQKRLLSGKNSPIQQTPLRGGKQMTPFFPSIVAID